MRRPKGRQTARWSNKFNFIFLKQRNEAGNEYVENILWDTWLKWPRAGYRRADNSRPVSSTVSAWEWVYATNLSRLQRETKDREREKLANGTWEKHTVYWQQRSYYLNVRVATEATWCHCSCSPILGSQNCVWPLRNREPTGQNLPSDLYFLVTGAVGACRSENLWDDYLSIANRMLQIANIFIWGRLFPSFVDKPSMQNNFSLFSSSSSLCEFYNLLPRDVNSRLRFIFPLTWFKDGIQKSYLMQFRMMCLISYLHTNNAVHFYELLC
jgi:hypothetical protein